jgi:hypothetical protein
MYLAIFSGVNNKLLDTLENIPMSLFRLSHFPICHAGGVTHTLMTKLEEIEPGIFREIGSEQCHNFRDSLKKSMQNSLGCLLASYSNWTYSKQVSLSIGNITRVEIPYPSGYEVYSLPIPTAIMGNVDEGEHCFPSYFGTDGNTILIGTTAHQVESNPIGKELNLGITAYCYMAENAPGWKKVLYSGLSNLSKGNTNVSVLLLSTAVDLYEKELFKKYLEKKGIEEKLKEQIITSGSRWLLRQNRITEVLKATLPNNDPNEINKAFNKLKEKVNIPRNKFAHEHSEDITKPDAHEAYCAAFDLLWLFDSLDTILMER